jgi:two-component system sensor kinase FixL
LARTQELQKLQRRSELILNAAADGICGFDLNGKITFANPAAARILGLSVEKMIGESADALFPAFKPAPEASAAASAPQPLEVVAPRPDGSVFAAEYVRSPIHEHDRLVGEVLVFKDITERKRAAELLAQRLAELTRSNAELEQFAFVASHDLQEPLRKIQAFGDRLKAKCEEAGLQAGRDYLERMQNAAARMQRLINDLLTFSRVLSRAQPFAPVDLNAVVREVLGDLEVAIEKSGARVEVGPLPTIEGDAVQLRQLLQNLIGNALKFQPPGAKPQVRIEGRVVLQPSGRGDTAIFTGRAADGGTVTLGEEFCELTVQDNGIGFDEQYLDKIFAVFTRLHGRQEYEGTGIGLAVCRRIVDRHGGSITARSQPGRGATFIVRLPLRQNASAPAS